MLDLGTLLHLMLVGQCGLDPRRLYENDYADLKDGDVFDFVVVGGGTSGSAVAGRLSENENWRVLVVEAGDYPTAETEIPANINQLINNDAYDWKYETEPSNHSCRGFREGRCRWPRGKMLGGSSGINAMIYVKGLRSDYDAWERLGNTGWGWKGVEPYFRRSLAEKKLNVTYARAWDEFRETLLAAGREAGYGVSEKREVDAGFFEAYSTIYGGRRCSAAKAYLSGLGERRNLLVSVKTHAIGVIFASKRATGLRVFKNGNLLRVYAKKEVVLSAGSINTPQLLMLSGIGLKTDLRKLGTRVLSDLPVGKNLQDHFMMRGIFIGITQNNTQNLEACYSSALYCTDKTGPLATTGVLNLLWFINTRNSSLLPNVQFHHLHYAKKQPAKLRLQLEQCGFPEETIRKITNANKRLGILNILPTLAHPKSRGEIRLKNLDPHDKPLIHANYLQHDDDLQTMLDSINHIKNLLKTPTMRRLNAHFLDIKPPNCANFAFDTREFWACNFRNFGGTVFHPVGTCRMGPGDDPEAVVDPRLSVYGVKNVRVVDASVMPNIINRNTNAACVMIGEKGAEMIKEDWERFGG